MFMNRRNIPSRRSFLKALGVGPALLPLLHGERAFGACSGISGPKRVFIIVWTNGMLGGGDSWATTGDAFVLAPQMASLEPYRQDLILMDGLDYKFIKDTPGVGERTGIACFPGLLTGAFYQTLTASAGSDLAGDISIDQYIGVGLQSSGYPGRTSLNLAVQPQSPARLSWKAAGVPILPDSSPYHVFSALFTGLSTMPTVDKIVAMRKSVLDYVAGDLTRFATKVGGTDDRARVNAHLQNVRDLEQRLAQTTSPPPADACAPPVLGPALSLTSTANFEAIAKLQIDLAVAALAADATRVVVLQLGDEMNANVVLTSLGFALGGPNATDPNTGDVNGLRAIAKRNGPDKVLIDTWFMSQVAYAIGGLKSVSDGAGTMLNNTALLAMNSMRTGLGETVGVPAILAGSCGGYFKTGRSLSLTNTPNNGVLIALANAMGIPTVTFGQPTYGGELTALKS
jgi:Protein of unknown function (DUF1552)